MAMLSGLKSVKSWSTSVLNHAQKMIQLKMVIIDDWKMYTIGKTPMSHKNSRKEE